MLQDKWVKILTILLIIAAVAAVGLAIVFNDTLTEITADNTEPAYMTKVFDKEEVLEINIAVDTEDWQELLENAAEETYINCDITLNGETFYNVGIRAKGNSSLSMVASDDTTDRYSFKVDFNQYIDGQTLYGLDTLALNNMMGDATYMKEYLSYDMFAAMGVATPGYSYAKINLNGEYWGLYLAVEVLEESFVERNYGSLDGNLYKPESMGMGGGADKKAHANNGQMPRPNVGVENAAPQIDAQNTAAENAAVENPQKGERNGQNNQNRGGVGGSGGTSLVYSDDELSSYSAVVDSNVMNKTTDADKQKVVEMIQNLNAGTDLENYLDVEEILRYFAVNTFLVNLDSYAGSMKHNYYLYEEDGVFQILPWDFNLAFGAFGMSDSSKVVNFPIDEPVTDTMENSPLISKLLEVEEYKEWYHNNLAELLETYVESGKYAETITKLNTLISDLVKTDPTAFFTDEEYEEAVQQLLIYGEDRSASIKAQLNGSQTSDDYGNLETSLNLKAMGSMGGGNKGQGPDENAMPNAQNFIPNATELEENTEAVEPAKQHKIK